VTLCIYALSSPAIGRIAAKGMAGERLRAVPVGSVAAIVGDIPRLPAPTERHLRAYHRIVQKLSERLPALIPARYGTTVQDLHELALILGARQKRLATRLAAVRNRVQMTARVMTDEEPQPPRDDPGPRPAPKTGMDYLKDRAREAALARDVPRFEPVRAAVRRWVREERVEKRDNVATVYHLIPRASADAYRRALEAAAEKSGVRLVVTGPWAPFAFADGETLSPDRTEKGRSS
jgi:hypothetical protein